MYLKETKQFVVLSCIFFLLFVGCKSEPKSDFSKIKFNAVSTLKIHFKNLSDTVLVSTDFFNFFPNAQIESTPSKLIGNGNTYIQLKTQLPQKAHVRFIQIPTQSSSSKQKKDTPENIFDLTCFLIPFDTLEVEVDYAKGSTHQPVTKFEGKYASISEYYLSKQTHFGELDFTYQKGMLANMATDLSAFKKDMDSITTIELNFLNTYKSKSDLPDWFVEYESLELKYIAFSLKLSEPMLLGFNRNNNNTRVNTPKEYFSFANDLPINNESAILSFYYFLSIHEYFNSCYAPNQIRKKPIGNKPKKWLTEYVDFSTTNLSPYISDVFLTRQFEILVSFNMLKKEDYELLMNSVKDTTFKNYMVYRFTQKKILNKGDKAPNAYLKSSTNEFLSLNKLKGNVIYLSFWISGCKPCIKEFPLENHLVDVFKNEKVKIISILMDSNESIWKQLLARYQLKTVNLIAKENWIKILTEEYGIQGYPHYVLIDKSGNIIENNCTRPSQGAEQQIRAALLN